MSTDKEITGFAVGDVVLDRPDPITIFSHVSRVFKTGDIVFCQLESPLSHTTNPNLIKKCMGNDPDLIAEAIKDTGFNIISFASNHSMEIGEKAFLETINCLKSKNLHVIGVGKNIDEARKPVIFELKGNRVAFLAYNSVGKPENWAQINKSGCVPLRASTFYEPIEPFQPGTPARIITFPRKDDLNKMVIDIQNAKRKADIVIVSQHCGIHMTPAVIADYQIDIAHAAVDAGADLILQHHAHILKGIEVYKKKVIFYGLGNFAIELYFMTKEWAELPEITEQRKALNPDWNPPYPNYPTFPFPPDSRKTIIVKYLISNNTIRSIAFLPVIINNQSEPQILLNNDGRFHEIIDYIDTISREVGFVTSFKIRDSEVLIAI